MGEIRVDGAVLSWAESGEGPPVVLVHAGVADHRMWDPLLDVLEPPVRAVAVDLRGFGASRLSAATPYRPVDDLAAVVDAVALDDFALVGASFGGLVALELAVIHPERVAALALLAPPLPGHAWSAATEAFGAREEEALEAGDIEAIVAANVEMWAHGSPAVAAHIEEVLREALPAQLRLGVEPEQLAVEPPVDERLAQVTAPALVVVGDDDVEDFQVIGRRLAAELPRARLDVVAGAGHLVALERPETTAALLGPFLEEHAAA